MNTLPIMYTDSIKYLGFTFTSKNCDDADIWKLIRMLVCRSNRLVGQYSKCSKPVLLELCRSFSPSSANATFVTNGIPNFEAFLRKSIYSFTSRISFSRNNLICAIEQSWVMEH